MGRFDDQRLLEIHLYGHTAGVPAEDCTHIQRKLTILLATPRWTGVAIVGDVFLPTESGHIGMMLTHDWGISFLWSEGYGPFHMRLLP
ncbi:MAG TPA: hypothetical protein VEZ20_01705 [Allosphingosinicella sp.]|jgi:hypothetical protein|nr:hypothetical protein [Allosphingosinicella sp.]